MIKTYLIELQNAPILEQLQLEEAIVRASDDNYILINVGSPPAIVLGISQSPEEMVDLKKASNLNIPLIRRFSGGGTVVVDEDTLFVTYIFNAKEHPFDPFPKPIAEWTEKIYQKAFPHLPFTLRENDYCLHDRKIGGNAQYLRKERWLHHTTLLFDYQKERMDLLLHPKKAPTYRQGREHGDFITTLSQSLSSKEDFVSALKTTLFSLFDITSTPAPTHLLSEPHRKSTTLITLEKNL